MIEVQQLTGLSSIYLPRFNLSELLNYVPVTSVRPRSRIVRRFIVPFCHGAGLASVISYGVSQRSAVYASDATCDLHVPMRLPTGRAVPGPDIFVLLAGWAGVRQKMYSGIFIIKKKEVIFGRLKINQLILIYCYVQ